MESRELQDLLREHPRESEKFYVERTGVPADKIGPLIWFNEPLADPSLRFEGTGTNIAEAREKGLRWERIAARTGKSIREVQEMFEEHTGQSYTTSYAGRGRRFDADESPRAASPGIFLLRGEDDLIEMVEEPYEAEEILQTLLAKYPTLLAGSARRWLLISREASLPSGPGGPGRWSVDHLFFDEEAVPTLIEVKRSTNTEIRREVVGQMLDYAANAVVYWPIDRLRGMFEATCARENKDAEEVVREFLGESASPDDFWSDAQTNLQAGRVRLVFVADEIPEELRRIIEFLNVQMNPAEVGVEIKQYVGEAGLKTLVPRLVGQTAEAEQRKGRARSSPSLVTVGAEAFLASIANSSEDAQAGLTRAGEWALGLERAGLARLSTKRSASGSTVLRLNLADEQVSLATLYSQPAGLEIYRSVFERRAPNTLSAVEAHTGSIEKSLFTKNVGQELLDALAAAYREASGDELEK